MRERFESEPTRDGESHLHGIMYGNEWERSQVAGGSNTSSGKRESSDKWRGGGTPPILLL